MTGEHDHPALEGATTKLTADRWHIGKEIPLALIMVVIGQTIGGAFWLANLSSDVRQALDQLKEFKQDRYTKEDGRRDREMWALMYGQLQNRDNELERRITILEAPPRPGPLNR